MPGPRHFPAGKAMPNGLPAPHGYDQCEFTPDQAPRDYARPRKLRGPDEERRHLRSVSAAIGETGGADMSSPKSTVLPSYARRADARWDNDGDPVDGSSRLYRE
ncbi:hypothetical protein V5F77_01910 [Xanthobacter sp. DSM 24535]|uniref:hypothetical protein n=1 Tax=Roseixanthobacter psychrophilus TaxID=3119917 RepID=UPI00372A52BF